MLGKRLWKVMFAANCPDGGEIDFDTVTGVFEKQRGSVTVRVNLWIEAAVLYQIYEVIAGTGLLRDTTRLAQWPTAVEPQVSDSGIRVLAVSSRTPFMSSSHGLPPRQFLVDIRMNGMWTRLFPPASWPSLDRPDKVAILRRELLG